jgi:hypothetical protein
MKRLIVFFVLAASSTAASMFWLHNGELDEALEPIVEALDAQLTPLPSSRGARSEPTGY